MELHDAYIAQWLLLAIDIMNEPRWRGCDTVATGLLKVNPDFFQTSKYLHN